MSEREITPEIIRSAICSMVEVERTNQGLEVYLPQIYHSGHNVAVVVRAEAEGYLVHDNSYAAMILANLGIPTGKRLADVVQPEVEAYGCRLDGMRVMRRCHADDDLGVAMTLVGCASRLIADRALKNSLAPIHDFKASLLGKVVDTVGAKRVRTNEQVSGHLGGHYRVSAVVLDRTESKPIAFVEPIADREAVARRFKEFYDIKHNPAYASVERVAVHDDGGIPSGDALLLEEVGHLIRFSQAASHFSMWTRH
ncbi:hypothetical protein [Sphingomonas sp. AX6]|uniref:hypothetical protein n=1 Tax=Sphingomonas sp. AX6 TaxID=2653171 RepID=UPI0012F194A5|nr:hypothetical protein [Sphingomonas sp. AX6]VXC62902.1 conserved hypothetical protein [Sphingomonas sp. AX6]